MMINKIHTQLKTAEDWAKLFEELISENRFDNDKCCDVWVSAAVYEQATLLAHVAYNPFRYIIGDYSMRIHCGGNRPENKMSIESKEYWLLSYDNYEAKQKLSVSSDWLSKNIVDAIKECFVLYNTLDDCLRYPGNLLYEDNKPLRYYRCKSDNSIDIILHPDKAHRVSSLVITKEYSQAEALMTLQEVRVQWDSIGRPTKLYNGAFGYTQFITYLSDDLVEVKTWSRMNDQ